MILKKNLWYLLSKYITLTGLLKGFTALKIVKMEAGFFYDIKHLIPFAFKHRPVITSAYTFLHELRDKKLITPTKESSTASISPLSKFKIKEKEISSQLEKIEEELKNMYPNLGGLKKYISGMEKLSEKEIEKRVDDKYDRLIRAISPLPAYIDPDINEHINKIGSANELDKFVEQIKNIKQGTFLGESEAENRLRYIKTTFITWLRGERGEEILMTEPYSSKLKSGECEIVCNFRFLEFLRDKDEIRTFETNGEKFVIAFGKCVPEKWHPFWSEMYVFNITELNHEFIRDLERSLALILAQKFEIPEEWKKESFKLLENCFYGCIERVDSKTFDKGIGEFGGGVYFAYPVGLSEWTHKPTCEQEVGDYLKELCINLQNDFLYVESLKNISIGLNDRSVDKFLEALQSKLSGLKSKIEEFNTPRPLKLEDIRNGVFDCEAKAFIALYYLIKYGKKLGLSRLKLVYIPREAILDILQKHRGKLPGKKRMLLDAHIGTITRDHLVILIEIGDKQKLFDPTEFLYKLQKDFSDIIALKEELIPKKIVQKSLEKKYFIEISIPNEIRYNNYTESRKNGFFVLECNPFSTYCLIAPLNLRFELMRFKNVFSFILYYSDKHLQAGLPLNSILGDTLRRLLISMKRYPKTKKSIFIKTDKTNEERVILERLDKMLREGIDEIIRKRGRLKEYSRIIDQRKKKIEFEELNINELNEKVKNIIDEIYHCFELPERSGPNYTPEKTKPPTQTLDAFSSPNEEDLERIRRFTNVSGAYDYCVKLVKSFGKLYKNGDGILRYQIPLPYILIGLEKWDDLNKFAERVGILNDVERDSRVFGRFSERFRSGDINKLDEFIKGLIHAVEHENLNFSRDLDLVSERDSPEGNIQIGWSKVKVSLDREGDTIIMVFHHILRSIDVHNGLPYNFYYSVRFSERVREEVKKQTNRNIRIKQIIFSLGSLHAYYDNLVME